MKSKRLTYNSELHSNHRKEWTTRELVYLCGVYNMDKKRDISIALERTENAILQKANDLKKQGYFNKYKEMYEHGN